MRPEFGNRNCTSMVWLADYIKNNLLLQLVDVSESHQSANGDGQNDAANVKLVFNQNWRPGVTVSSLIIQRVNKSHNGVFQCIPSNSEAKQIKVHVLKGKKIISKLFENHFKSHVFNHVDSGF